VLYRLFVLFLTVPLMEMALLIWIGRHLGVLYTVAIVVFTAAVGAYMARREGLRVWDTLEEELRRGRIPGDTVIDGVLVLAGGLFFITPGLMTDLVGFCCLIPMTRRGLRTLLKRWLKARMDGGGVLWVEADREDAGGISGDIRR